MQSEEKEQPRPKGLAGGNQRARSGHDVLHAWQTHGRERVGLRVDWIWAGVACGWALAVFGLLVSYFVGLFGLRTWFLQIGKNGPDVVEDGPRIGPSN